MSIRAILILILACSFSGAFGQDSLALFLRKVGREIERSIPNRVEAYSDEKEQYFVLDLHLTANGGIDTIEYFGKPNASASRYVDSAIKKVLSQGFKVHTQYTRILIPLAFVFKGETDPQELVLFTEWMKNDVSPGTYLAKDIVITASYPIQ